QEAASILRRIGDWYEQVYESFEEVEPAPDWTSNADVLITRRNKVIYVHLNKVPRGDRVTLKPVDKMPKRVILLNTGKPVDFQVVQGPNDKQPYLKLRNVPVNELADNLPVLRLEFDDSI
ncbi:MAG: hypothetical protein ACOC1D_00955, partial [Prolixibacteraceae bacterium]